MPYCMTIELGNVEQISAKNISYRTAVRCPHTDTDADRMITTSMT